MYFSPKTVHIQYKRLYIKKVWIRKVSNQFIFSIPEKNKSNDSTHSVQKWRSQCINSTNINYHFWLDITQYMISTILYEISTSQTQPLNLLVYQKYTEFFTSTSQYEISTSQTQSLKLLVYQKYTEFFTSTKKV